MSIANALGLTSEQFMKMLEGKPMENKEVERTCLDYLMNFPPYMWDDVADDYYREQGVEEELIQNAKRALNTINGEDGMRVILNNSIYEMNRKQFRGVLDIAKKSVKMGIYAVEKDGIAEMKNEPFDSKEDLNKFVEEYARNGFKVHYNE